MNIKQKLIRWIFPYKAWLDLREESKDDLNRKLCYCGHTDRCSCADPDCAAFRDAVANGNIMLWDKDNGWRSHTTERLNIILNQVAEMKMDVEVAEREISKYIDEVRKTKK